MQIDLVLWNAWYVKRELRVLIIITLHLTLYPSIMNSSHRCGCQRPAPIFSQSTNAGDDGTKLMLQCMPVLPQDRHLVDPVVVGAGPRTVAWGLPRHARVARPRRVVVMVVMMMAMATAVVMDPSRWYLLGVVVVVCARARFDAETHVSKSVGSSRLMAWYVRNG